MGRMEPLDAVTRRGKIDTDRSLSPCSRGRRVLLFGILFLNTL